MKISKKVECGIIAMIDIALYSDSGEAVTVDSISKRQSISVKYLEQILPSLRQAHLIQGMKGCRGGYTFSKSPDKITLKDIINALDVTILNDFYYDDNKSYSSMNNIVNECFWNKITKHIQNIAESITLDIIAGKCRDAINTSNENFMYYI
ncbi:MAG: Rrf2 family transcriptional regulator [Acutalibacteraceae bacterium]